MVGRVRPVANVFRIPECEYCASCEVECKYGFKMGLDDD